MVHGAYLSLVRDQAKARTAVANSFIGSAAANVQSDSPPSCTFDSNFFRIQNGK